MTRLLVRTPLRDITLVLTFVFICYSSCLSGWDLRHLLFLVVDANEDVIVDDGMDNNIEFGVSLKAPTYTTTKQTTVEEQQQSSTETTKKNRPNSKTEEERNLPVSAESEMKGTSTHKNSVKDKIEKDERESDDHDDEQKDEYGDGIILAPPDDRGDDTTPPLLSEFMLDGENVAQIKEIMRQMGITVEVNNDGTIELVGDDGEEIGMGFESTTTGTTIVVQPPPDDVEEGKGTAEYENQDHEPKQQPRLEQTKADAKAAAATTKNSVQRSGLSTKVGTDTVGGSDNTVYKNVDVIQLTSRTFSKEINDGSLWLIEFYSPGCIHCVEFEPSYNNVAEHYHKLNYLHNTTTTTTARSADTTTKYKNTTPTKRKNKKYRNVKVAKIDGSEEIALSSRFGIYSFPSFYIVDGWSVYEYLPQQGRSEESLKKFVETYKKQSDPLPFYTSPMGIIGQIQGAVVSLLFTTQDLFTYIQATTGLSTILIATFVFGTMFVSCFLAIVVIAIAIPPSQNHNMNDFKFD
jgi:thiol-disulfide isomerase/thioredoxin